MQKTQAFHGGKRPGDRVTYMAYSGMGLSGPEYTKKSGKAALVYDDRIVVNAGGRFGRPVVVTADTFVA